MRNVRPYLELAGCIVAAAVGVHAIPSSFQVHQTYSLQGSLADPEQGARLLTASVRTGPAKHLAKIPVSCSTTGAPLTLSCSARTTRRSQARTLERHFREVVPAQFGKTDPEALRQRLRNTDMQISLWRKQSHDMEEELSALEESREADEARAIKVKGELAAAETDLANRRRQLEMIEEALRGKPDSERTAIFQTKKRELGELAAKLEATRQEKEEEWARAELPLDRASELEETLPRLRAQIDLAQARMTAWNAALEKGGASPRLADPDAFQIRPLTERDPVRPLRDASHLPWSLVLGGFLFSLLRGASLRMGAVRYLHTPEEVARFLRLRYLGSLP